MKLHRVALQRALEISASHKLFMQKDSASRYQKKHNALLPLLYRLAGNCQLTPARPAQCTHTYNNAVQTGQGQGNTAAAAEMTRPTPSYTYRPCTDSAAWLVCDAMTGFRGLRRCDVARWAIDRGKSERGSARNNERPSIACAVYLQLLLLPAPRRGPRKYVAHDRERFIGRGARRSC